jgi:DNA-binding transcriptional MerR regulator
MNDRSCASFSGLAAIDAEGRGTASAPACSTRNVQTIAEVAAEFGVTQRALRFYEAKCLLAPRREGGVRIYDQGERWRLARIVKAKSLGFTLGEIHQMLSASPEDDGAAALGISRRQCCEQIELLELRKREIEAALAELRRTYSSFYVRLASSTG